MAKNNKRELPASAEYTCTCDYCAMFETIEYKARRKFWYKIVNSRLIRWVLRILKHFNKKGVTTIADLNTMTPYKAYLYARNVLKRRWEEAEPVIMTDPDGACYYARYVLNRRWLEAEPLMKGAICWNDYKSHFDIKE